MSTLPVVLALPALPALLDLAVRLADELLADVTLLMADNGISWGSLALSVSAARRIAQGSEADSDVFLTRRES
jgi:hypothetical protein